MKHTPERVLKERLIALLITVAGTYAVILSLAHTEVTAIHFQEYVLVFLFAAAMILADRYPIHLLRGTKVCLINLPIFLSTALLRAPLAMIAIGIGLLVANLLARVERGLLPRDIASMIGQWLFTAFWGHQIIHLTLPGLHWQTSQLGLLFLCALFFLLLDFVIFSLSQALINGEPFLVTLKTTVYHGLSLEIVQYLIGILGALAAYENAWSVILLIVPISITYLAFKNVKEMRHETVQILEDLADTVDLRDRYTGGHSRGVADLVHRTLIQLKISGPEAMLIETSARLHDIGKIGIPDSILKKPGQLLPEEMAVMRTHPQKGAELISKYKDFSRGAMMIMHHHERWDGLGYPSGLKEYAIPFGARVIAVVDSFDAMTSDRPYRKAVSTNQAIQTLLAGGGTQWDPNVVNAFADMIIKQTNEQSAERFSVPQAPPSFSQDVPLFS